MKQICSSNEIADPGSKEFTLEIGRKNLEGFIVHKDGEFFAYKNSCPHTGANLNWKKDQFLDIELSFIQCSTHNALFECNSGYCIAGPCSGSSLEELKLTIIDNEIFINL